MPTRYRLVTSKGRLKQYMKKNMPFVYRILTSYLLGLYYNPVAVSKAVSRRVLSKCSLFFKLPIHLFLIKSYSIVVPFLDKSSLLAIYDFRAAPYDYSVVIFLANAEAYRIDNSLAKINLVMVLDGEKKHRGDQPEVTKSNYRNWLLNLAECADLLQSVHSLSIFENDNEFLSFYYYARKNHKVFPNTNNNFIYEPTSGSSLGFRPIADFFYRNGYVPKFTSSPVLLEWVDKYLLKESYPRIPVLIFIRNYFANSDRNTNWSEWLTFFKWVKRNGYPIKFIIVNDYWTPVEVPDDYLEYVTISQEATISTKYRNALMQRVLLIMGQACGPFWAAANMDTPFLMFGMEKTEKYWSLESQKEGNGFTNDWQLPWLNKYQRIVYNRDDADYIKLEFSEMFTLLEADQKLAPSLWYKTNIQS